MKGILMKPAVWQMKLRVLEEDGEAQTRRLIEPQPREYDGGHMLGFNTGRKSSMIAEKSVALKMMTSHARYHVGETVYIKEAWAATYRFDRTPIGEISHDEIIAYKDSSYEVSPYRELRGKWRSPLFMPEWFARYFIRITDVRPERLQEITEADALAEGMKNSLVPISTGWLNPIEQYARLWDSINKKHPWKDNDWVWVYTFKRVVR